MKQVYIKTFGCQMNERDSEIMAQSLLEFGYIEGMEVENADLVILNTCSIRAKAEQKVLSLLGYLKKYKQARPSMKICVTGCVAQQEGNRLIEKMGHVDLVVGTQNIYDIGRLIENSSKGMQRVVTGLDDNYVIPEFLPQPHRQPRPTAGGAFRKFVTIMQGCNNYCTYCVVPYTRGRESSRKSKEIIDEVKVLVEAGVKEITLLGQNVNSYGRTNEVKDGEPDYRFADLLREVSRTEGLRRLRFTTSNPKDLTGGLIDCFRDIDILCPQFHLPVQAGSDRILQRMNRKYSVDRYLELVDKLREACPPIALTTDVIVGFPGETDADFEGTMGLLEKVRFHGSFSFKYSDRPGTRASSFPDKVEEDIKKERLARFQKRQDEISLERNMEYVGQTREVMMESCNLNDCRGRTDTNHIVHFEKCFPAEPGQLISATITSAGQHSLKGERKE
jgi:tRNA-2-methylthio-N6-dimethylallyladenosine synthase